MLGDLLPVNEVFDSLQGEGHFTGTPSTFIRLQGCPVGCPWCDTKYTWAIEPADERPWPKIAAKTEQTNSTYARVSISQLIDRVTAKHIVVTGGEPAQYDLTSLSSTLIDLGRRVQIETSGTFPLRVDERTWVTVSPKLNMPGGLTVKAEALARADEIKHVVGKPADVEALKLLLDALPERKALVYVQPLSGSAKATRLCTQAADANGWRVSIQTHRLIGVR